MLNVVMLCVIILNVIMLIVVSPLFLLFIKRVTLTVSAPLNRVQALLQTIGLGENREYLTGGPQSSDTSPFSIPW